LWFNKLALRALINYNNNHLFDDDRHFFEFTNTGIALNIYYKKKYAPFFNI